jgi:hypothetical protein
MRWRLDPAETPVIFKAEIKELLRYAELVGMRRKDGDANLASMGDELVDIRIVLLFPAVRSVRRRPRPASIARLR